MVALAIFGEVKVLEMMTLKRATDHSMGRAAEGQGLPA